MEHTENTSRALAAVVASRLEDANLSRRQAAARTGIPLTTLTRRLNGTSPFSIVELASLANVLGTTVSRLAIEAEGRAA